jgi:uncharacterized protein (DUF2164 family)
MKIEIPQPVRNQAIASLQRYFEENLPEAIGDLPAGLLFDFFVEEIGPLIYNRAIADAQAQLAVRVSDLSGELWAEGFQYWPRVDAKRRARKK